MNILGTPEEVRERHGVTTQGRYAHVNEGESDVRLVVWEDRGSKSCPLTPAEARHLASKLRRLAYRVEARQ